MAEILSSSLASFRHNLNYTHPIFTTHSLFSMSLMQCKLCGSANPNSFQFDRQIYNLSLRFHPHDVARADAAIQTLRAQIAEIQQTMERLHQAKLSIETHLQRQSMYLAPIHRVPDDVLLMIFQILVNCWSWDEEQESRFPKTSCPSWSTASVSKRWRALSLTNPRLWENVVLFWHDNTVALCQDREARCIRLQLQRTGRSLLRARLHSTSKEIGEGPEPEPDSALQIFIDSFPRCRTLELENEVPKPAVPLRFSAPLNNLEELHISGQSWTFTAMFKDAPKLRFVTFSGLSRLNPESAPRYYQLLPWSQLTLLNFAEGMQVLLHALLRILRSTVNLSSLTLAAKLLPEGTDADVMTSEKTVELGRLQDLDIELKKHRLTLTKLLAPRLRTLTLSGFLIRLPEEWQAATAFIQRSGNGPTITSLNITDTSAYSQRLWENERRALRSMLTVLPSIQSLSVHDCSPLVEGCRTRSWDFLTQLLGWLTFLGTSQTDEQTAPTRRCPNLEHFCWTDWKGLEPIATRDFPWEALQDMVHSRTVPEECGANCDGVQSSGAFKKVSVLVVSPYRDISTHRNRWQLYEGFRWLTAAHEAKSITFRCEGFSPYTS